MTQQIKLFGLQRSGTNYVAALLTTNFDCEVLVNNPVWKHGCYIPTGTDTAVVYRSPYHWLTSVWQYWKGNSLGPDLRGVSFETFCRSKATFEQQQGVPFLYRASNPVQYWNNMSYHWISIRPDKGIVHIPYEGLLNNLDTLLLQIQDTLKLTPRDKDLKYKDCTEEYVPSGEQPKSNGKTFDREKVLKRSYMSHYNPALLEWINEQLDWEVMDNIGYKMEVM